MPPFRRPGVLRRAVAMLLSAIIVTGGCTSWRTSEVPAQTLIAQKQPKQVRITVPEDERWIVRSPHIAADTLRGLRGWRGKDSVAVDLRSVSRVEVQRVSAAKTTALVVVVGGMIAGVIALSGMGGWTIGGVY